GRLYHRNGLTVALALAFGLALFLVLGLMTTGSLLHAPLAGNFYAVFPHNQLVLMFGTVFGLAVVALAIGAARFWRGIAPPGMPSQQPAGVGSAAAEAVSAALRLDYLDGGHGLGCNEADDRFTLARRRFHH